MKRVEMTPEQCEKFDKDISVAIFLRGENTKFDPTYIADLEEKLYYFRCNNISRVSETSDEEKVTDYVIELHGVKYIGIEVSVIKEDQICDPDLSEVYILMEESPEEEIENLEGRLVSLEFEKLAIESKIANLKVQNAYRAISTLD